MKKDNINKNKVSTTKKLIVLLLIIIACLMVFSACGKTEVITDVSRVQIINSNAGDGGSSIIRYVSKVEIKGELVTIYVNDQKIATAHIQNVILIYKDI